MPGRNSEELQQADTASGASSLHIEAENYLYQSGAIASESCSDVGGGQDLTNIGGSYYAVYSVTVAQAGTYLVKFRVAGSGGTFQFKDSSLNILATVTVPNTGSGQTWQTITATVVLRAGTQQVHFYCTQPGWNLNWLEFVFRAGTSNSSSFLSTGGYRYGFNGKENDNEMKSQGNQQDYGMRIYDPRLGRFLSVDPITKQYPELTPYQFASNNPIAGIDLDGLEFYYSAQGKFLGQGGDPKNLEVRLAKDNGLTKTGKTLVSSVDIKGKTTSQWVVIHNNHKEFLDRAHMAFGEGGNNGVNSDGVNPALYFAQAFENFKTNGLKKPQTDEEAKIRAWKDATHSYKDGTIQTTGKEDSPYNLFNNARKKIESGKDGSAFAKLPGAENVISVIITVLLKNGKDPTNGGYQWVGGSGSGDDNDTWNNKVPGRIPTAKINTSSIYYKSYTVFYRFQTDEEKKQSQKSNENTKVDVNDKKP